MPNTFSPLIVPATMAQEDVIRQLLLYFDTVFLYAPSENSPASLPLALNELCRQYAPVPFGASLANFEQLIRDMTNHRAGYYGGSLSSLAAQASAIDEESVWRLIKKLSAGSTDDPASHETLCQARLLLKLAEIRDQEEHDIARTLAALDTQGKAMLHGLTDGDEDDAAEMGAMTGHAQQRTGEALDKRLQAWSHLFLADPRINDHWLLAAPPDVMAVLTDYATTSITETPVQILSLPLPRKSIMGLSPAQYLTERMAWKAAADGCLSAVRTVLAKAVATGLPGDNSGIGQEIRAQIIHFSDWGLSDQDSLDLWLLPRSLPRIFAKLARREEPPVAAQSLAQSVVAVPRLGSR